MTNFLERRRTAIERMKDFNEREDFLLGCALSDDARRKRNDRPPNRFGLRTCDFYALGAVGIQDIFV
jgi:hypothetical protein